MRKVLLLVAVGVAGLLLYWAWTNHVPQHAKKIPTSKDVVDNVVESGRAVGEKAGDVFDSLGFGGTE